MLPGTMFPSFLQGWLYLEMLPSWNVTILVHDSLLNKKLINPIFWNPDCVLRSQSLSLWSTHLYTCALHARLMIFQYSLNILLYLFLFHIIIIHFFLLHTGQKILVMLKRWTFNCDFFSSFHAPVFQVRNKFTFVLTRPLAISTFVHF